MTRPEPKPVCPYCGAEALLHKNSGRFYGGRDFGPVWACVPCKAWVGVHKNSRQFAPLGRLANKELREWKIKAHAAFDPLWRGKMNRDGVSVKVARSAGYAWLADKMRMTAKDCHIGYMDVHECKLVVTVCNEHKKDKAA